MTRRGRRGVTVLVALGLAAAACGGSGSEDLATDTSTSTSATTSAPSSTTSTTSSSTSTSTSSAAAPASPVPPVTETTPPAATEPSATDPAPADAPGDPRIAAVSAEQLHASWRPGCPVGPDGLRAITITHLGFDGASHTGTMVVRADWAADLLGVFDQLYASGYPIERIEPVDVYGGSDDASMAVNNTSAFNCRPVTGGTGWSRHAYGTAIDLNPRQNPYVTGDGTVLPPEGAAYVDRHAEQGVINRGNGVVEAFAAIGWRWGGDWHDPVDYQHFDIAP